MSNLIDAAALRERMDDPNLRIVDARFVLTDPPAGRAAYAGGHLPGAVYLHLDEDLSSPVRPDGIHGRHPLPDPETFAARLGALGIGDEHDVVAYDDAGGAFAVRVWWLLRWLGRPNVRVLDGGLQAWLEAGGDVTTDVPDHPPARSTAHPIDAMVIDAEALRDRLEDPETWIVDARAGERFRGETEPLDRKAGHVPGALNRPFTENLDDEGRFLSPAALRARFEELAEAREIVCYCGSGVTGAHDVLAIEEAGLGLPTLYAGSWSDWSSRPDYPVATGDEGNEHVA